MSEWIDKAMAFLEPYLGGLSTYYDELMHYVAKFADQDVLGNPDVLTSLLFFLLEIVVVLIIVIVMMMLSSYRKRNKDLSLAQDIKDRLEAYLPKRKENLRAMIGELVPHDEEWASKSAQEAADYEKSIYSRILKIIMRQELDVAQNITNDVERLGESYKRILSNISENGVSSSGGGGDENEKISELKSIVGKLRKEKQKLQDELEESVKSVDDIVKEYSRMYSDSPHKEGVEHLEKEVEQLREKIGEHLSNSESEEPEQAVEDTGEIIDLQADIPEPEEPEPVEEIKEEESTPEVDPSPALKKLKEKIGFGDKKDKK